MTNKFAERLKHLIKINKLHYKDIEAKTGIKDYTIKNYVNSLCEPDINSLIILADLFNVSTDYLIGFSDSYLPGFMDDALLRLKHDLSEAITEFNNQVSLLSASHKRRC